MRAYDRSLSDFKGKDGLLPAENELLRNIAQGKKYWIGGLPKEATEKNRIRASFLRFLALGGDENVPMHEKGIRVQGAYIEGELDLESCKVSYPLHFVKCWIENDLIVRFAQTKTLDLSGSHIKRLDGVRTKINGSRKI